MQGDCPESGLLSTISDPGEESPGLPALSAEQALSLSNEDAHQDQSAVSHDWSSTLAAIAQEKKV